MLKLIDSHPVNPFTADQLQRRPKGAPPDEFGVSHHDVLYSETGDRLYCVLDAPAWTLSRNTARSSASAIATRFTKRNRCARENLRGTVAARSGGSLNARTVMSDRTFPWDNNISENG